MSGLTLIHVSGRSNNGQYLVGFMNESTPPTPNHFRVSRRSGTVYDEAEAASLIKKLAPQHPDAVFVFRSI